MNIRDLEWLRQLVDVGHVTEAAALLGTTQPTLSRAVARMEAELGVELLVRTATGVHATPAGRLAAEAAEELVERYRRLTDDLAALLDPETGTVRLAFLDSLATSLVPGLLREVHARAPRLRVLLRQEPAHVILADLEAGAVDVAITSFGVGAPLVWHPLQRERLVVVVPPRHPLAGRARVRLAELADEELVTTPRGYGHRHLVDDLLTAAGVRPPVSFESQDLATIEGLVAAGLGVAVVPEAFAGQSGSVGLAIGDRGASRSVGLAWHGGRSLSPAATRFLAVARRETPTVGG
ncbi:LysR family transcriptional regulator [Nocardioides nanhaiensis]|uniref:LysR family transcriptional regulator n=1 Tax=Nocardioides nanhaiensis TaxID=1476871 RepID=A0ABP8WLE2_9ACTN